MTIFSKHDVQKLKDPNKHDVQKLKDQNKHFKDTIIHVLYKNG
jgi:hypothetical protein